MSEGGRVVGAEDMDQEEMGQEDMGEGEELVPCEGDGWLDVEDKDMSDLYRRAAAVAERLNRRISHLDDRVDGAVALADKANTAATFAVGRTNQLDKKLEATIAEFRALRAVVPAICRFGDRCCDTTCLVHLFPQDKCARNWLVVHPQCKPKLNDDGSISATCPNSQCGKQYTIPPTPRFRHPTCSQECRRVMQVAKDAKAAKSSAGDAAGGAAKK